MGDTPAHLLDATAVRDLVAARAVSAVAIARSALDRVRRFDGPDRLHAFLSVDEAGALAAAEACDRRLAAGGPARALEGVPVAVKDNLHAAGLPTTCASRILLRDPGRPGERPDAGTGFRPPRDATAVARLRAAGAVVVGKTNLDEFAMGSSTENSAFGPSRNPWDTARVPGGSSGGSAAAVAAALVPLALGSDTGGSIRQPAAMCGVVGLKPTWGRVSRWGLVAFGSSLDQVGPLCRSVRDAALALSLTAGKDPLDATSLDAAPPDRGAAAGGDARGLRVGLLRGQIDAAGVEPAVRAAVLRAAEALAAAGATVVDADLPHAGDGIAVYYLVATAEASSNLARFDGVRYGLRAAGATLADLVEETRDRGFGPEVKRRILLGTFALSAGHADAYHHRALRVRRLIADDFERAFRTCDVLLGPTAPTTAFPLGAKAADPLAMYLCDVFSVPADLAGVPAISVPFGLDGAGLPVAVHLQAAALREDVLLRAAAAVEAAAGGPAPAAEAYR